MNVHLAWVRFAFTSINAGRRHHRPRRPAATRDALHRQRTVEPDGIESHILTDLGRRDHRRLGPSG